MLNLREMGKTDEDLEHHFARPVVCLRDLHRAELALRRYVGQSNGTHEGPEALRMPSANHAEGRRGLAAAFSVRDYGRISSTSASDGGGELVVICRDGSFRAFPTGLAAGCVRLLCGQGAYLIKRNRDRSAILWRAQSP